MFPDCPEHNVFFKVPRSRPFAVVVRPSCRLKLAAFTFKVHLVPRRKLYKTVSISDIKISELLMYTEATAVFILRTTQNTHTLCGQNF